MTRPPVMVIYHSVFVRMPITAHRLIAWALARGPQKEELMARRDKNPQGSTAKGPDVSRRKFMAGAALTGAAGAGSPQVQAATAPVAETTPPRLPSALRPNAQMAAAETGTPKELAKATGPDGSDFM